MSPLTVLLKLIWPWPGTPLVYGIWLSLLQPTPSPRYQPSPAAAGVAKAMSDAPASAMVLSFISEYPRFEITICHRQRMTTLQWLLDVLHARRRSSCGVRNVHVPRITRCCLNVAR